MWFIFSLLFAFTTSVSIILAKKIMTGMNEYLFLFLSGIFTIPFLFLIIMFSYPIPKVDQTFWIDTGISTALNVLAGVLAYRAIRISEVSLISPVAAFNPIFTAIISFFTLREVITEKGWFGILLICVGAYLLQRSKLTRNFFEPIKLFFNNRAIRLSLLAYFIWALTPIFQKVSIIHTYPEVPPYASFIGLTGTTLIYAFPAIVYSNNVKFLIKKNFKRLLLFALLGAVGQAAAFSAFSLTSVGLATALFKLSIIFSVVLGWIFFKEHDIKSRLAGSLVMLSGVALLVI